eukprot:3714264-Amphidinium_carterae.1
MLEPPAAPHGRNPATFSPGPSGRDDHGLGELWGGNDAMPFGLNARGALWMGAPHGAAAQAADWDGCCGR